MCDRSSRRTRSCQCECPGGCGPVANDDPWPLWALHRLNPFIAPLFLPHSFLVFHGGSGSEKHEIKTARENGVVKMNVDTDTQWAYCIGLRDFYGKNVDYLKTQVGNPEGA